MKAISKKTFVQPLERRDILHLAYLDDEGYEVYYSYTQHMRKHRMVVYWYIRDEYFYKTSKGRRDITTKLLMSDTERSKLKLGEVLNEHSSRAIIYFQSENIPYELILLDAHNQKNCIFCIMEKIAKVADIMKMVKGAEFIDLFVGLAVHTNIGTDALSPDERQLLSDRVLFHINFSHFLSLPLRPAKKSTLVNAKNIEKDRNWNPFLSSC